LRGLVDGGGPGPCTMSVPLEKGAYRTVRPGSSGRRSGRRKGLQSWTPIHLRARLIAVCCAAGTRGAHPHAESVAPKIRDEILEDAAERDFPRILGSTTVPGFPSTGSSGDFLPVGWDFRGFQTQIRRWRLIVRVPKSTTSARDHDVSEMAPPSRMMRAHRSRIAANMSNMAAPICKKICRPWRTILPAV
jgi:hypothetical protein